MLAQRLPTSNDSYALQAAIESSQYYSQPLLRGLSSQQSSAANRSLQQDVLSLSGQMHLNRNNNDMLRFAGGSFLGGHGLAVNDASNLNVNPHQSLFASSLGPTIQALNLSNSADLGSLGITRQYLELLQNQQTAASLAHLAGVGNSQGDAALQRFANDRQNNGRQN